MPPGEQADGAAASGTGPDVGWTLSMLWANSALKPAGRSSAGCGSSEGMREKKDGPGQAS